MQKEKNLLRRSLLLLVCFCLWTVLVQTVDTQSAGETGTVIGFAALNSLFHDFTGVHMWLYTLTDWLGLVPVAVGMGFAFLGLRQLLRRRSLWKVDPDLLLLGGYYTAVIFGYLIFEIYPVNYRPVFIENRLEASYPSSTTLLVLSVMPTLAFQTNRRLKNMRLKKGIAVLTGLFSVLMVFGRLLSGVHWVTDIIGAVFLSRGLFSLYHAAVLLYYRKKEKRRAQNGIF